MLEIQDRFSTVWVELVPVKSLNSVIGLWQICFSLSGIQALSIRLSSFIPNQPFLSLKTYHCKNQLHQRYLWEFVIQDDEILYQSIIFFYLGGCKEFLMGSWRYKTFSRIVVPSCFNSYTQILGFFFSTADNWIMITPIYKPRREEMWHYHCKEKKWALRWGRNFKE